MKLRLHYGNDMETLSLLQCAFNLLYFREAAKQGSLRSPRGRLVASLYFLLNVHLLCCTEVKITFCYKPLFNYH